jgi:hypothetical protein
MIRRCRSWHSFSEDLECDLNMEDIILVTGRSLTRDWATFSFDAPSNVEVSIQFQAGPVSAGVWGSWSSNHDINSNEGPSPGGDSDVTPIESTPEPPAAYNQSVFIQGFRACFRVEFFRRLHMVLIKDAVGKGSKWSLGKPATGSRKPNAEGQNEGGHPDVQATNPGGSSDQDTAVPEDVWDSQGTSCE